MSIAADLKILYQMACAPIRGKTHAARLESFYRGQAEGYDSFRRRLLPGREELVRLINLPEGGVWIDMGGGTGANLEYAGDRLPTLSCVHVVDLCPPLLEITRQRIGRQGWTNVETAVADAATFAAPAAADAVTFSYSLTMIPDWFAAIDRAWKLLKPGGQIGVVDFHISRKHQEPGRQHHGWLTRSLLPFWFGCDNVFLSADHLPYLAHRFQPIAIAERRARIPYLPLARVPYYLFIGLKAI